MRLLSMLLCLFLAVPVAAQEVLQRFNVSHIDVVGNTVLSETELAPLVKPYEGRPASFQDLLRLAGTLTETYRKKGYFLATATVPPQHVVNGQVTIHVTEGRIGGVMVEGNRTYPKSMLTAPFARLMRDKVAYRPDLDHALSVLESYPNLQVTAVVRKGIDLDTADVVLQVHDTRTAHVGVDFDTFGDPQIGQDHTSLVFGLSSLMTRGDGVDGRVTYVSNPALTNAPLAQVVYSRPLGEDGSRLSLGFTSADFAVGGNFAVLDLRGNLAEFDLTYTRPAFEENRDAMWLFGYSTKLFSNFVFAGTPTSVDNIRELNAGYTARWNSGGGSNTGLVMLSGGLGGLFGGTAAGDPLASRAGASDSFTKVVGYYSRIWPIGSNQGFLRISGQVADQPLLLGEEFGLGGPESVRGYTQSEVLGDSAYAIGLEFRHPLDKEARQQLALFVDHGVAYTFNTPASQSAMQALTGAGFGWRARCGPATFLRADVGFPLNPPVGLTGQDPVLYVQFTTRN
ncbi:MAG: ShlB/FhaC/HecB family hemolysin secretion/activation protein [Candidatus Xenobia bacterium]